MDEIESGDWGEDEGDESGNLLLEKNFLLVDNRGLGSTENVSIRVDDKRADVDDEKGVPVSSDELEPDKMGDSIVDENKDGEDEMDDNNRESEGDEEKGNVETAESEENDESGAAIEEAWGEET